MQRSYLFLPVKSLWSLGLCVTSAKSKASHGLYTSFPCTLLISWHFISRISYIEDFKLMKRRPFWKLSRFILFSSLIPLRRAIKESTYCSSGLSRAMHSSRCAIKGLGDDLGRCSAWPQHLRSSHTTAGSSKARSTWPTAPKPAHYDGQPHRLLTMMDNPKIGSRHSWQAILWGHATHCAHYCPQGGPSVGSYLSHWLPSFQSERWGFKKIKEYVHKLLRINPMVILQM